MRSVNVSIMVLVVLLAVANCAWIIVPADENDGTTLPANKEQQFSGSCCNYDGVYTLELIPHPFNCNRFSVCEPHLTPEGRYITRSRERSCPEESLFYDFRQCKCLEAEEATCFDGHWEDFFACTNALVVDGRNITCS